MTSSNPVYEAVLAWLDQTADVLVPGGVADHDLVLTSVAFDYYIAKHGIPKTANEARRMFEFAAMLDRGCVTALHALGIQL